ncbi:MAG TPA: hypothetical protein ENN09_00825, partial [Planctomycetes bacterium]|nr:hypothetical protein [Planctomycetota bacterium]
MTRQRIIAAAVAAVLVMGGLAARYAALWLQPVPLYVVNGFEEELTLETRGREQESIGPLSVLFTTCPRHGTPMAVRKTSGEALEDFTFPVKFGVGARVFGKPAAVYNVASRGIIELRRIPYAGAGASGGIEETRYTSERFITFPALDVAFTDAPQSVPLPPGKLEYRQAVDFFAGRDIELIWLLEAEGRFSECEEFAVDRFRCGSASPDLADFFTSWYLASPDAGIALIDEILVSGGGDMVLLHRVRQDLELTFEPRRAVVERYRRLYVEHPSDPSYAYLYARMLSGKEALDVISPLLESVRRCPWLAVLAAQETLLQRRFAEAARLYMTASGLLGDYAGLHARIADALLIAGRSSDVLELPFVRSQFPGRY